MKQWSGAYDADYYRAIALLKVERYDEGRALLQEIIGKKGGRTKAASRLLAAIKNY